MTKHYWVTVIREQEARVLVKAPDDLDKVKINKAVEKASRGWNRFEWEQVVEYVAGYVLDATETEVEEFAVDVDLTKDRQ